MNTTTLAPQNPAVLAPPGRRNVLDDAHVGDIHGALGTLGQHEARPRSRRRRLLALLAIMGPGLIVMVGDNDAGGVATYAQAGQNYKLTLLWTLLLLIPVLIVNQEMVVRLGAVTGVGHARLIIERFGKFWGAFSVGDLFILNFLTIVTEFIGVSLALGYFGVSKYVAVPVAAAALIAMTMTGSFRRWERFMYVFVVTNFVAIPLAILSHPHLAPVLHAAVTPGVQGGINSTSMLLIIAIVGTTVAPWQLFFQQSNVIDKRITPRWINYERADTVIGSVVVILGAAALMIAAAFAFGGTRLQGQFVDAGTVASGLAHTLGPAAGALFAIALLNAAIIGAAAVTLASSYAFGDVFRRPHSLHHGLSKARLFHGSYAAMVVLAAAIVLIPGAPLGTITTAVQALAGVLLPSATVFLLLLCNDKAVLGPWTNPTWLNALASAIIGVLVILSAVLTVTTLFPHVDVTALTEALFGALAAGLASAGLYIARGRRRDAGPLDLPAGPRRRAPADRDSWTMPSLELLERPTWSRARTIGMYTLRGYLVIAVLMLIVKAIEVGIGH
ncbi:MAG TPA: NRAMP family divalent metal transporter [Solirubrobacteraceae bacterium]|nr:NRAMP family divalent metal transporter [Solirubrobacteraceae bacterium]